MNDKKKLYMVYFFFLILIIAVLAPEMSNMLSGLLHGATAVGMRTGVGNLIPIITFAATTITAFLVVLLLFTPGKKINSPIFYWMNAVSNKILIALYEGKTGRGDVSMKKYIMYALLDAAVFLLILVLYKFIIKDLYYDDFTIIGIIGKWVAIFFIMGVNSYIVSLSVHNDDPGVSKSDEERLYFKYGMVIATIASSVILLVLMNSISGSIDKAFSGDKSPSMQTTFEQIMTTKIKMVNRD